MTSPKICHILLVICNKTSSIPPSEYTTKTQSSITYNVIARLWKFLPSLSGWIVALLLLRTLPLIETSHHKKKNIIIILPQTQYDWFMV